VWTQGAAGSPTVFAGTARFARVCAYDRPGTRDEKGRHRSGLRRRASRGVAGLVLVDALSEALPARLTPEQLAVFERLNTPQNAPAWAERVDWRALFAQLGDTPAVRVPTVVLSADKPQLTPEVIAQGGLPPNVDQAFADALWAAQVAAQDKLARRRARST
jgi:hypothetical protein